MHGKWIKKPRRARQPETKSRKKQDVAEHRWRKDVKKPPGGGDILLGIGGVDGTRTRDPRRDRPVF